MHCCPFLFTIGRTTSTLAISFTLSGCFGSWRCGGGPSILIGELGAEDHFAAPEPEDEASLAFALAWALQRVP